MKAVIYDADGVVINKPRRFSQVFTKEYGVTMPELLKFFDSDFQKCILGQGDLKVLVQPFLPGWGWKGTVEEFLSYWFTAENFLDRDLIADIARRRQNGQKCFLASEQEHYRAEYIGKTMGLKEVFDDLFFSSSLGYKKTDLKFWDKVHKAIGKPEKSSVIFWDDEAEAVETARQYGFAAEVYKSFSDYKDKMEKIIQIETK